MLPPLSSPNANTKLHDPTIFTRTQAHYPLIYRLQQQGREMEVSSRGTNNIRGVRVLSGTCIIHTPLRRQTEISYLSANIEIKI